MSACSRQPCADHDTQLHSRLLVLTPCHRNGWGASAIDGLTTAIVMDIPEIVGDVLKNVGKINFAVTQTDVNLFETTIRYLGGLISGFELLKGPKANLVPQVSIS